MVDRPKDYDVGYGRPPKEGKFQKGRSGNPGGRKKKLRTRAEFVMAFMNEKVMVKENGRAEKIPKFEALIRRLYQLACNGNIRAIKMLWECVNVSEPIVVQNKKEVSEEAERFLAKVRALQVRTLEECSGNGKKDHDDQSK